ncbi:hypothetical protein RCH07_002289 [Arthrobacter sp. CG_A4]|nr:hypothetical protein [Arthrobacter sp. CG_A4]
MCAAECEPQYAQRSMHNSVRKYCTHSILPECRPGTGPACNSYSGVTGADYWKPGPSTTTSGILNSADSIMVWMPSSEPSASALPFWAALL